MLELTMAVRGFHAPIFCPDVEMKKELLLRKAKIEDWEREYLSSGIPFGFCNREWEELRAKMEGGDEIWFWSTDAKTWAELIGMEGMALVRHGEVIDWFITALN